ncbi:hypothetical protein BQ8482_240041 [Mesorhizobium delmotii]|uniref:Uncharacterized protein n=1 Tax=Mesorhizobium delmotii TaxID=1631247 RepID=A0A2P9ALS1_9HYPH|nr:hypothetical protein BQ8482_240041 [Mesorhizobium delmotii]
MSHQGFFGPIIVKPGAGTPRLLPESAKKHENPAFLALRLIDKPLHIPVMSGLQYPRRQVTAPRIRLDAQRTL